MSTGPPVNAETGAPAWAGLECPTCHTDWPAGTQFDDEAAHWKEQALRHCIRADRAEALLAERYDGSSLMDGTTVPNDYEIRLAALDRAIGRLHADRETGPDEVVALAATFEAYLRG